MVVDSIRSILLPDAISESSEFRSLDVKHPLEIRAHLALYLLNLLGAVEIYPTMRHDLVE
jgi:hypothetical protein